MLNKKKLGSNDVKNETEKLHAVQSVEEDKKVDMRNAFADGFPEWNIDPPQVIVRRRKRL